MLKSNSLQSTLGAGYVRCRSFDPKFRRQFNGVNFRQAATMVLTESGTATLGSVAPLFELGDTVSGKTVKLEDYKGAPATLVIFMCNHCPFVVHLLGTIAKVAKEYQARGAKVIAISANSAQTHPQDGPEPMGRLAKFNQFTFPYLYDETQEVAQSYQAACTPEFVVLNSDLVVQYHGRFDSSTPGNRKQVTGEDVRAALDEVMETGKYTGSVKPSMGCSIKWHPGNVPAYF